MDNDFEICNESFNISKFKKFVLVADIGGENSYFAIMGELSKKEFKIILRQHIKTRTIKNLSQILNRLLEEAHRLFNITLDTAVITGAGAVSQNRETLKLTNHDLEISVNNLKKETLLPTFILMNNFEAEGYGIDYVDKEKMMQLSHIHTKTNITTSAILGAGHGLGASIMYYDSKKHLHVSIPSEAGHMSLPVELYFDLEFVNYIKDEFFEGRQVPVSSEFAVSGKGICLLYDFIVQKKIYGEPRVKLNNLEETEKLTKIFEHKHDIYCKRAVELFVSYYARVSRNLAIITQPYAGLFLTGRVTTAAKTAMNEYFLREFLNCATHKEMLKKIPIFVVEDTDITLLGACNVAVNFVEEFS